MKKLLLFLSLSLLFLACNDSESSDPDDAKNWPIEQKLAVLDEKGPLEKTDPKVQRIKALLDNLSASYHEPVDSIAEATSRAQDVLHDRGVEATILYVLEEMKTVGKVEKTSYRESLAFYIMLSTHGAKNKPPQR